ncbi:MAG: RsmB/NOP family class I SAM-dependent RNA methyltransferase [Ignavibacteriaceae bacterium]|nr:RsmB/NOP family class I SAM-dependent RNA methyltransferase [Ignavibacteriaceae bacterium]
MIKIFPNLLVSVYSVLREIFQQNHLADIALERSFKLNKKYGARDRRFVAEAVYDIIRNFRLYSFAAGRDENDFSDAALRKLVQTSFLSRKVDAQPLIEDQDWISRCSDRLATVHKRKYIYSLPDWLDEYGTAQLGEAWDEEMKSQHTPAEVFLRVNTLKCAREDAAKALLAEGIESDIYKGNEALSDLLKLKERGNVFRTESFKKGMFEVQDGGSQLISIFLDPKPGERVIDACAGGGGKSLHIAALMKNKGKIISMDTVQWKLDELKKRGRRNGVDIIETKLIDSTKVIKRLSGSADKVLLDVPCSGSGVFRRNPDAKWKLTRERIDELISLQEKILHDYAAMVKPGGVLVYSTCSVFPDENERQTEKFVLNNPKFRILTEKKVKTSITGFDGFYMCKLTSE